MQTEKDKSVADRLPADFYHCPLACIAYIFRNSLQTGAESSLRSQAVTQAVNETLYKVHMDPVSEHTIRKVAHYLEFTMEGFLLMLCLRVYTSHFVRHM